MDANLAAGYFLNGMLREYSNETLILQSWNHRITDSAVLARRRVQTDVMQKSRE